MSEATFISRDNTKLVVEMNSGSSLAAGAGRNDVAGIIGRCGGARARGICRVHMGEAWADEGEMPETTAGFPIDQPESRH